jgi:hypothetical protein
MAIKLVETAIRPTTIRLRYADAMIRPLQLNGSIFISLQRT